jgi:inositol phosphorylceramide mannosyltransferase catalytic subunit
MKYGVLLSGILLCALVQGGYLSARRRISSKKSAAACAEYMMIEDRLAKGAVSSQEYRNGRAHFDALMSSAEALPIRARLSASCKQLYELFAHLFASNRGLFDSSVIKIPKKIHQIWLGSEPPADLLKLSETVKKLNPDFEYRLWRDCDVGEFCLLEHPAYKAAKNWGERADILRYHILYTYGGFYCDMDILSIKSFEPLCHGAGFVVGISNLPVIEANNAVMGAAPRHPVLKELKSTILARTSAAGKRLTTISRTGPVYLTRTLQSCFSKGLCGDVVVVPIPYFYPLSINYQGQQTQEIYDRFVSKESYCVHLWEGRWKKPEGRVP